VNRAGLNHLRFHDLRHAHASLMLQQGIHPKVVSERLGHSGVGITLDIYSHVLPGLQAEAAAQLDRLFGTAPSPTSQQDVSKC
jgi:integrase